MVSLSKVVKEWGKSLVIVLSKEDRSILKVNPGDIITFEVNNIVHTNIKGDEKIEANV